MVEESVNQTVGFGIAGIVLGLWVIVGSRRSLDTQTPEADTPYGRAVRNRRRGDRLFVGPVMVVAGLAVVIVGAFHLL